MIRGGKEREGVGERTYVAVLLSRVLLRFLLVSYATYFLPTVRAGDGRHQ